MLTKTTFAIVAAAVLGFTSSAMATPKHHAAASKHHTYQAKQMQRGNTVQALRTAAYRQDLRLEFSSSGAAACGGQDPDTSVRMSLVRECQQGF